MLYRASEFVHGLIGDMIYGSGNNSKGIEGVLAHFKYDCLDRYPRAYCTLYISYQYCNKQYSYGLKLKFWEKTK